VHLAVFPGPAPHLAYLITAFWITVTLLCLRYCRRAALHFARFTVLDGHRCYRLFCDCTLWSVPTAITVSHCVLPGSCRRHLLHYVYLGSHYRVFTRVDFGLLVTDCCFLGYAAPRGTHTGRCPVTFHRRAHYARLRAYRSLRCYRVLHVACLPVAFTCLVPDLTCTRVCALRAAYQFAGLLVSCGPAPCPYRIMPLVHRVQLRVPLRTARCHTLPMVLILTTHCALRRLRRTCLPDLRAFSLTAHFYCGLDCCRCFPFTHCALPVFLALDGPPAAATLGWCTHCSSTAVDYCCPRNELPLGLPLLQVRDLFCTLPLRRYAAEMPYRLPCSCLLILRYCCHALHTAPLRSVGPRCSQLPFALRSTTVYHHTAVATIDCRSFFPPARYVALLITAFLVPGSPGSSFTSFTVLVRLTCCAAVAACASITACAPVGYCDSLPNTLVSTAFIR